MIRGIYSSIVSNDALYSNICVINTITGSQQPPNPACSMLHFTPILIDGNPSKLSQALVLSVGSLTPDPRLIYKAQTELGVVGTKSALIADSHFLSPAWAHPWMPSEQSFGLMNPSVSSGAPLPDRDKEGKRGGQSQPLSQLDT